MSRVLVDQLRALADRLRSKPSSARPDVTRRFWLIARQLRAALPPLLLSVRGGPAERRIGYILFNGAAIDSSNSALRSIEHEHAASDERLCLFVHGDFNGLLVPPRAKLVDITPLNDIQAARIIAD